MSGHARLEALITTVVLPRAARWLDEDAVNEPIGLDRSEMDQVTRPLPRLA